MPKKEVKSKETKSKDSLAKEPSASVKSNDWVAVEYEGKLKDGKVFDCNTGKEPLVFKVGSGMVIKGFDNAVLGLKKDGEVEVTIKAKEAYGEKNSNVVEIPKASFGDVKLPKEGQEAEFMSSMGPLLLEVVKIEKENVKVIVNHPLAGKDLIFKIKLKKILSKKESEELEMQIAKSCASGCHSCSGCH